MNTELMLEPVGQDEMLAVEGGMTLGEVVAFAVKTLFGGGSGGGGSGSHNLTNGNISTGSNSPVVVNNNNY